MGCLCKVLECDESAIYRRKIIKDFTSTDDNKKIQFKFLELLDGLIMVYFQFNLDFNPSYHEVLKKLFLIHHIVITMKDLYHLMPNILITFKVLSVILKSAMKRQHLLNHDNINDC